MLFSFLSFLGFSSDDYGSVLNEVTARVGQEKVGYSVTYRSGDSVVYASKTEYTGKPHL